MYSKLKLERPIVDKKTREAGTGYSPLRWLLPLPFKAPRASVFLRSAREPAVAHRPVHIRRDGGKEAAM